MKQTDNEAYFIFLLALQAFQLRGATGDCCHTPTAREGPLVCQEAQLGHKGSRTLISLRQVR